GARVEPSRAAQRDHPVEDGAGPLVMAELLGQLLSLHPDIHAGVDLALREPGEPELLHRFALGVRVVELAGELVRIVQVAFRLRPTPELQAARAGAIRSRLHGRQTL